MDVSWNWGTSSGFPMLINNNPHSSPLKFLWSPHFWPARLWTCTLAVKKTHPRRYPELRRYEKPGYIQALHPLHPSNAWRVPGSMWFRMHTGNTFSPVTHDCGSKPPNRDLLLVNPLKITISWSQFPQVAHHNLSWCIRTVHLVPSCQATPWHRKAPEMQLGFV